MYKIATLFLIIFGSQITTAQIKVPGKGLRSADAALAEPLLAAGAAHPHQLGLAVGHGAVAVVLEAPRRQ